MIKINIAIEINPDEKNTTLFINGDEIISGYDIQGLELIKTIVNHLEDDHFDYDTRYKNMEEKQQYINNTIASLNALQFNAMNLYKF